MVVQVTAEVEQMDVVQAVASAAYRLGARYVDAQLRAPTLQRSLVVEGPAEAYVPAWANAPTYGIDEVEGARITVGARGACDLPRRRAGRCRRSAR